ncbi:hypothetical protein HAX54_025710 [Datura stramonium]|uniref:J domain-containing protein n=1 Tax=Datura stramonium TaxID=4076 RepID=A0ABS8V201_DATST|nr:hypothetical protein [Datura stramonium]
MSEKMIYNFDRNNDSGSPVLPAIASPASPLIFILELFNSLSSSALSNSSFRFLSKPLPTSSDSLINHFFCFNTNGAGGTGGLSEHGPRRTVFWVFLLYPFTLGTQLLVVFFDTALKTVAHEANTLTGRGLRLVGLLALRWDYKTVAYGDHRTAKTNLLDQGRHMRFDEFHCRETSGYFTTAAATCASVETESSTTSSASTYSTLPSNLVRDSPASFYEILGIPMGATIQEIKAAYRRLARVCHPDVASIDQKDSSADDFMKIHAAYSTLSDPDKRADYDRRLFRRRRSINLYSGGCSPSAPSAMSGFKGYTPRNWETDQCW